MESEGFRGGAGDGRLGGGFRVMSYKKTIQAGASEDRLEKLIQARLRPGADKEAIDRRIWDLFGEEWCVMFTDLSGFSRWVARFGRCGGRGWPWACGRDRRVLSTSAVYGASACFPHSGHTAPAASPARS